MNPRIVIPGSTDDLAAILSNPTRRDEYLAILEGENDQRRMREFLFDAMRVALRQAAFNIDSTRLIMSDPETRDLAKELAEQYRELADKADACAVKP